MGSWCSANRRAQELRHCANELACGKYTLTDDDVVFTITPRINAASRMDEPEAAFKLLSATKPSEADVFAEHLQNVNNARKGAVAAMTREINTMLADRELPPVIVVGNTHWRPGLLGLAASKVVETHNRPAFVWGRGEAAMIKGSCRSDGSYNVMTLMTEAREHFVEFGGHKHSGGFSTTVKHIVSLEETLTRVATSLEAVIEEESARLRC
jgi:single-stranded-DNA-specific exonuclease